MISTPPAPVIAAVDGSDSSIVALRKAAEYAATLQAELLTITCWKAPDFYTGTIAGDAEIFRTEAAQQQEAAIERAFPGGCPVTATRRLTHSRPAPALIAASEHAQLLVLGTRGHGEFAALILGSVSLECITYAHCPVLTVRAQ